MRIYVASSWRNKRQPAVVEALRGDGHQVYDFRNPEPGDNGFAWSEIDPDWQQWTPEKYREMLAHPIAHRGFSKDMRALEDADYVVLVMPCGRSAHLEFGHGLGRGKPCFILMEEAAEPELMYAAADYICLTLESLRKVVGDQAKADNDADAQNEINLEKTS